MSNSLQWLRKPYMTYLVPLPSSVPYHAIHLSKPLHLMLFLLSGAILLLFLCQPKVWTPIASHFETFLGYLIDHKLFFDLLSPYFLNNILPSHILYDFIFINKIYSMQKNPSFMRTMTLQAVFRVLVNSDSLFKPISRESFLIPPLYRRSLNCAISTWKHTWPPRIWTFHLCMTLIQVQAMILSHLPSAMGLIIGPMLLLTLRRSLS